MNTELRRCPFTEEDFVPNTPEHYFSSKEAFEQFIDATDPMDEFVPEKREINWSPQQRIDPKTGEKFLASHPAQKYATPDTLIKEKIEETNKRTGRLRNYEPRIKECNECHRQFIATKPAMRYCEDCSPKGGKLVQQ